MRPIRWLHISDFHLRPVDEWSQDVVLESMCRHIEQQYRSGTSFDFVLVTGDIAFSGQTEEYVLAKDFFNDLQLASGVPIERMFCVPGNHDIDRARQKLCFTGARTALSGPNQVDALLAGGEDLNTILSRQDNFRQFQCSFFAGQNRAQTQDGLGYVSWIAIEEIRVAIIGFDSAWLAEGGIEDHGKLLIGERQAINAMNLLHNRDDTPHIVIGMAHHPLHWLQEFDRGPVQNMLEEELHFFHCGHLHEPNTNITGYGGPACLTVAAGAAFESRNSHNAYSIVTLDILQGTRKVDVLRYNRLNHAFSRVDSKDYPIEVAPIAMCSLGELASAIETCWPKLGPYAFYLASLLLGKKTDIPVPSQEGYVFGSIEVMQDQSDSPLKRTTIEFMTFKNVLRVLYDRESLPDILKMHGGTVGRYGEELIAKCVSNPELLDRLISHNRDSRVLSTNEPRESFSHTLRLFHELASNQEWYLLREQAARHLTIDDLEVVSKVKRYLALALANSEEQTNKAAAIELYSTLAQSDNVGFTDLGNLATLLLAIGCVNEAGDAVLDGIEKFPERKAYYFEIGQRIVEATGNRELRRRIETATEEQT